ncbi:GNAT family N-acetyltransferase [Jatrophihabitans telluris]|uniref:GNAT family N-acetyltransferase n=1 Tax=Jatrophihabitans telluris TaxID=2038343 RepID=A0ABY4R0Q0_9ACTN|nr:GNAT family protein [Jatrophihabitans telluris]UQX89463.1 GNAT family N-acetyltransferase [Jatrophihabitans telluris]
MTDNRSGWLHGELVRLRPVRGSDVSELLRILRTEEVWRRWGEEGARPGWPFDDPDAVRYAILRHDAVRGLIQYEEETEPMYRHASIDIFLDPAVHGQGLGRDSVRTVVRHLLGARGHHRIVIDPAADNEAAIRCYSAVGFRPVGLMRRYELAPDGSGWHDGLLMDLLAGEVT